MILEIVANGDNRNCYAIPELEYAKQSQVVIPRTHAHVPGAIVVEETREGRGFVHGEVVGR